MKAFLSSWWKRWRARLMLSFVVVAAIIVVVWIIFAGGINGSGFTGGDQITTSTIISGPSKGAVTQTEVYQQGKTLWDWLQLLIVPAVLAVGGALISMQTSKSERDATAQRDKTERDIAQDNQREASLQDFIDKMSDLLLKEDLRNSKNDDEIQKIARVRTLTILSRLDPQRKRNLLQFLYEADLINKTSSIVLLTGADLSEANLREADLRGANLSEADLREVNLSRANLSRANLSEANLSEANLFKANLNEADLSRAKLSDTNLFEADLGRVNLSRANLSRANLSEANLSEANLSEARLQGADLEGADLTGADLRGADLTGAILTEDQLDKAKDRTEIRGLFAVL